MLAWRNKQISLKPVCSSLLNFDYDEFRRFLRKDFTMNFEIVIC